MSEDAPFVPSNPPEDLKELHWWLHNEFIMAAERIEAIADAAGIRTYTKWDDLRFPANALDVNPTNAIPSSTYVSGIKMIGFEDTYSSTAALGCIVQLPHAWKLESSIGPHLHTKNINSLSGDIRWGLTYTWSKPDEVERTAVTVYATQTLAGTADKFDIVKFPHIDGAGMNGVSSIFMSQVFRLSGDAADTATGTIALIEYDIHYQLDSSGSRQEYAK